MPFELDVMFNTPKTIIVFDPYTIDRITGTLSADPTIGPVLPSTVECFGDGSICEVASMSLAFFNAGSQVAIADLVLMSAGGPTAVFSGTWTGSGMPEAITLNLGDLYYDIDGMGCSPAADSLCDGANWVFSWAGPFLDFTYIASGVPGPVVVNTAYTPQLPESSCEGDAMFPCGSFDIDVASAPAAAPTPTPIALFGIGLLALVAAPKRRRA